MTSENPTKATLDRRKFLSAAASVTGATVGGLLYSEQLFAGGKDKADHHDIGFPPRSEDTDVDWAAVKSMFALNNGLIALNAANLCPASRPVTEMLFEGSHDIDGDPSFENRLKYDEIKESTRNGLALMLGADSDEIALTRNTSESNRVIIGGIDLGKGDEVIIWDQNHESNSLAWDVWSDRYGFTVKRIKTPDVPKNDTELLQPFINAFSPKTKLVSFSHVSNISGIALPAQKLCQAIRGIGALSLVDGAQTFGMAVQNLHDMGCDFYTGSAHKWLCGPRETGVLYIRKSSQAAVWPSMVTHDWAKDKTRGARKFDNLGQRDDGRLGALGTAVDLHQKIGGANIEHRVRSHVTRLMDGLKPVEDKIHYLTPTASDLRAGIVIFLVRNITAMPAMKIMYQDYGISMAAADIGGGNTWIRFAPHIYNTPAEIDTAVKAVKHILSV